MKALSIRQPWPWMILFAGKDIENRTWRTNYRGPILIHAGLRQDPDGWDILDELGARTGLHVPDEVEVGGIVGQAEVVDCVDHSDSPWFNGPFGIVLANVRALPFRPCKGKLGLFEVN